MDWIIENRNLWFISGLIGYAVTLLGFIGLLLRISYIQRSESFIEMIFNDRLIDILSEITVYAGIYSTVSITVFLILDFIFS